MKDASGEQHKISLAEASTIIGYLYQNDYVDDDGRLTPTYLSAADKGELAPLPPKLQPISEGVMKLVAGIFNPKVLDDMVEPVEPSTPENNLNENFDNERFQEMWNEINNKYVYTVHYDSNELIEKVVAALRANLTVTKLQYVKVTGTQDSDKVTEFGSTKTTTSELTDVSTSNVPYDLVGDIARGARLTRRSVVKILQGIENKILLFKNNPEEFIRNVVKTIREQKATMIVEHISYNRIAGKYDSSIFVPERKLNINKVIEAQKHITPYIAFDSEGEKAFAEALEGATEVQVYAKLPRKLKIPTPVGNYAPDWAIVFNDRTVRHVFFVAETKGSLDGMELRGVEKAKTECAKKLFNRISTSKVRYGVVDKFENLYNLINGID